MNDDEKIVVHSAMAIFKGGDNYLKNIYVYPGLALYYNVAILHLVNLFTTFDTDYVKACLILRSGNFLINSLSLLFLFYGARLILGRKSAFISVTLATFSAFYPSFLYYAYFDTPLIALSNILFWVFANIYKKQDFEIYNALLWYPIAFALIGLSMAIKYQAIFFLTVIIYLFLFNKFYYYSKRSILLILYSSVLTPIFFLVTNPHFILNISALVSGIQDQSRRYHDGHIGQEPNIVWLFNLKVFLFSSYGLFGAVLFIIGFGYLIKRKKLNILLFLLILPFTLLSILSVYKVSYERNLVLIMPYFYLIASLSLYFWNGLFRRANLFGVITLGLLFTVVLNNIITVYKYNALTDARVASAKWIEDNIPIGSTIYIDDVNLGADSAPIIDQQKFNLKISKAWISYLFDHGSGSDVPGRLMKEGDYYVASSYLFRITMRREENGFFYSDEYLYQCRRERLQEVLGPLNLVKEFRSRFYEGTDVLIWGLGSLTIFSNFYDYYSGPTIRIYKRSLENTGTERECIL